VKRNLFILSSIAIALVTLVISASPTDGKMDLKVGDTVYACSCGTSCPCQTIANRQGTCHCGAELAKVTVAKVADTTADLKFADGTRTFSRVGKYTCGCGESCSCKMISQAAGKCGCGTDLVKVGG
jgi:hypothetical protein